MKKFTIFLAIVLACTAVFSFKKEPVRMPSCYYNNNSNGADLNQWAAYTGAGMAMYGYTNIHYEDHCCTETCYAICASICGTPPDNVYGNYTTEAVIVDNIGNISTDKAKLLGEQAMKRVIKDKGQLKDISIKDGIVTITYLKE